MAGNQVDPNKLSQAQKRRAEQLEERLQAKGLGRDEAEKRARAIAGERPGGGGAHSGGEPKKGASHVGGRRMGSDKEAK